MKQILTLFLLLLFNIFGFLAARGETTNTIEIFEGAVFYDGYQMEKNPDKDSDDGILRHSCSLYSLPLTDEQLDRIGNELKLHVDVQALCDNYDRIGNVNIAFVEKGQETYDTQNTPRIEIGRFITPFMNKNKEPDTVPYEYDIDYLSPMFRDQDLRSRYDYWIELEIFGVPYAANKEISGCKNRSDVFKGFARFETSEPAEASEGTVLIPIVMKKPEYIGHNLNNYSEEGTDTIGKCTKTYIFDLPEDVSHAKIILISSNHGSNYGGEEYKRRDHYIYVDDILALSYKPGRESCEPFRKYNTQGNGIYGSGPMSNLEWQSFSNWCPGDVIDNRIIELGDIFKGEHKIRISVPKARFVGKQGDFPISMYLIAGEYDGSGVNGISTDTDKISIDIKGGILSAKSDEEITDIEVYSISGVLLCSTTGADTIDLSTVPAGVYLVNINLASGPSYTRKILI